jgi:hypothetical protein
MRSNTMPKFSKKKIHVVVCAKKTNLSVINNKIKYSKQHQILLFLHRPPNMSFFTRMLLAARKYVHVQFTKDLDFFNLFAIFFEFLLDQEHMISGSNVDLKHHIYNR